MLGDSAGRPCVYGQRKTGHRSIIFCLAIALNYFLSIKGRSHILLSKVPENLAQCWGPRVDGTEGGIEKKGRGEFKGLETHTKTQKSLYKTQRSKGLKYFKKHHEATCYSKTLYIQQVICSYDVIKCLRLQEIQISTLVKDCHGCAHILVIGYSAYWRLITAMTCASLTLTVLCE